MNMWLERQVTTVNNQKLPIIISGSTKWGSSEVISSLLEPERPLVWIDLHELDASDPIHLGNALADALCRVLGSPLFGYGLPFQYGVKLLGDKIEELGPFTLAISNAQSAPLFARSLLKLHQGNNRVILHSVTPLLHQLPQPYYELTESDLALRLSEVEDLAPELTLEQIRNLRLETDGAYESLLVEINQRLNAPPPLKSTPAGPRAISPAEAVVNVDQTIQLLQTRNKYMEALELAVAAMPSAVPSILRKSADSLLMQGRLQRISDLIGQLPNKVRNHDELLSWRLMIYLTLGFNDGILKEVERRLSPALPADARALYAEVRLSKADLPGALLVATEAVEQHRNQRTLYAYGRILGAENPQQGLVHLESSLRHAEEQGETWAASRAAAALAARSVTIGKYSSAISWAEWGLKLYHQKSMGHAALRLRLINELAFARLLSGQATAFELELNANAMALGETSPALARLLTLTSADILLASGQSDEALHIYKEVWHANLKRENIGALANLYVRGLLSIGESGEAIRIAKQAVELTRDLHVVNRRRAQLALGMALTTTEPPQATKILEPVLSTLRAPVLAPRLAQASMYLATALRTQNEFARAETALEAGRDGLNELAGAGKQYLADFPDFIVGQSTFSIASVSTLELSFLGTMAAQIGTEVLPLRPRLADLLAVLAMHKDGLTGEQLALAVYGERGTARVCAAEVARLRKLIPILTNPYRVDNEVSADFLRIGALLAEGKLMQALALYRGPLLPTSTSPAVVTAREVLDESLRRSVLASRNPDAQWILAEKWPEDLELWEALLDSLLANDPRRPLARARMATLLNDW